MGGKLFREKAVRQAASPEQLNEYIKVANPGIWVTLLAVLVLLAGVCAWGVWGRIETTVDAVAISDGRTVVCYLAEREDISSVRDASQVKIEDAVYAIQNVSTEAQQVKDCAALAESDRAKYLIGISDTDWVYEIALSPDGASSLEAGIYRAKIVTERISPMSFVVN